MRSREIWRKINGVTVEESALIAPTAKVILEPYLQRADVSVGESTEICDGVLIAPYDGSIHIGHHSYVGPYCVLYGHGGLLIGNNTLIAAHTTVIPANHVFASLDVPIREQGDSRQGITIGNDVWLGTGVRVLDGVNIGDGCVVGAGAVVTKSLPPYSIAVGVPARVRAIRGESLVDHVSLSPQEIAVIKL